MTKQERRIKARAWSAKWRANNQAAVKAAQYIYNRTDAGKARSRKASAAFRASLTDEEFAKWRKEKDHGKGAWYYFCEQLEKQKNRCLMCGVKFKKRSDACLDHDHETDQWRGVLCALCNRAVGYVEKYGEKAIAYLNKWRKQQ